MPDPSTPRIMVVDDDPTIRDSVTAVLRASAYEVSSATDGYDALWQLKSGSVDLMITDLEMPGLSSVEFLSVIRERFPEMVVIAMSGRSCFETELATGVVDAFYPKGRHGPKKLLVTIAQLLRYSGERRRGSEMGVGEAIGTGRSSDRHGPPQVPLACPGCFESCAKATREGSVSREVPEISCVSCGRKLGYVVAFVSSTAPAREGDKAEPQDDVLTSSCVSTWEFPRRVLRKLRQLGRGLARRELFGRLHRYPSRGTACDPADAKQFETASQDRHALHREERPKEGRPGH